MKQTLCILSLILLTFTFSCSSDDDASAIDIPALNYTVSTFNAVFFQAGNASAPSINWNGDQGSFSLATALTGLSINNTNGIVSWDKTLPIGIHDVQAIATNSAGQTTANLTINNPLQGVFTGTIDNGSNGFFEVEFFSDGTTVAKTEDSGSPPTANGTWTNANNNIVADVTNPENGVEVSLSGTLTIGTTAVYAGQWHDGHGAANPQGSFSVVLN
ncbi:MAG: hypothetical protein WA775_05595 [Psychroserpens sp.]|uniref:hypothetical protein n=1 Tax=Psychroserpens sp. TaxID=2020870 RepID=UPI003C74AFE8